MHLNLLDIWNQMGGPVRGVVVVLTVQALGMFTVTMDRVLFLLRARRADNRFGRVAGSLLERGDLQAAAEQAKALRASPLANLVDQGLSTFLESQASDGVTTTALQRAQRAVERHTEVLSERMNKGMNVIASTGSTAPFVGLLGTVLGIIAAFRLISASGSGGIGTIGSAIGEALVVTGYGLVVAIPAVLVFNALSLRIDKYESKLRRLLEEMFDRIGLEQSQSAVTHAQTPVVTAAKNQKAA